MARSVKVGAFQAMQRQQATGQVVEADPFAIDPAAEDAAATARLKEIGCGPDSAGSATANEVENGEPSEERAARILAEKHARGLHAGLMIGGCPACDPIEPKAEDRIDRQLDSVARSMAHAVASGRVAEISVDPADGINAPEPTIADDLQSLDVGAGCTAEMSLHMITERVRVAAEGLPNAHEITESDVVLEAERIWVSLDRKRSHTYSVEQDGTIRDWRRPDTTPDRGDVTKEHTITDETEEQRFSGAGAEDGQQASMFLVPADSAFNGRQYRDAPELANIAEGLISEHGFLEQLENCDVRWYWKRKTGVSKGRVKIGFMKRASDLLGHFSGADFIGWLSATTARDGKFTDRQVEAAVFHQLCHIGSDDSGNWIFAPHDFEGFAAEVRVFGTWTSDLKLGGNAFVAAHQMGLFSDEDDREEAAQAGYVEAPDGAGTLIHPDGTPLTDDEIEAMERHELNDDPADPDVEYDGDPLADVDL